MYSFIKPEDYQPSGSFNFSIDSASLQFLDANSNYKISILLGITMF